MGSFASKLFYSCDQDESCENRDTCSTPMKYSTTPPLKRKILSDPRSATIGLARTPIDVTPMPEKNKMPTFSAIPKRLQSKPYLETNFDETIATSSMSDPLDPRSPNAPLPRTPIVLPLKSQDNCNLREKFESESMYEDPRSPSIVFDRTPILKPKSPVNEHKSSEPRLLFCETISDDNIPEIQALPDIVQNVTISRQTFVDKLAQADVEAEEENCPEDKIDKVEELPLSTQKIIDNILMATMQKIEADEKIQIYEDSETIKLEKEVVEDKLEKSTDETERVQKKDVVIDVDENEKSDDTSLEDTRSKKEMKKAFGQESAVFISNRAPLGIRSNNHNQLQIHKKTKNSKSGTHPTIKSKAIFTNNQQENTPPGKKTKSRLNATQWDPDSTIVI